MTSRGIFTIWAALWLALGTTTAAAQPTAPSEPGPSAPGETRAGVLRPEVEEAQGTCATPRQAWLQLLYWLQKGQNRWVPEEAARCLDTSQLGDPRLEGPQRAVMLKEVIDAMNARVDVDAVPTNPDYRDNDTGRHSYWEPRVEQSIGRDIYLVKDQRTGRWLFSAETVAKAPGLYPVTGYFQRYLPPWANMRILGIELWKYAAAVLLFLLARLVSFIVMLVLGRYARKLVRQSGLAYLDRLVDRAERPIALLVMVLLIYLCIPLLLLPIRINELAVVVIKAVSAYTGVWLSYRLIDVLTDYMVGKAAKTDSKLDDQLVPLVSKSLKLFVSVIGGIFILQNLSINVGSLLAGLGLGGLAFALAAKDTVANFFGSVMIFVDKPFQIGDWVVIGNTEGIVEEVGFRTSRVRTFYNSLVTVPNSLVTNAVVDNYGARRYRRYTTNLSVTYDTPPEKMQAFCEGIRAIIAAMPDMRKDYYLVEFKEFGDSGLVIMVYCFMVAGSWNHELRIRTNLNLEILRLAETLGVGFAFPTQTLHISSMAQPGDPIPGHSGPSQPEELAEVVRGFASGGTLGQPKGRVISGNYDCDAAPTRELGEHS